jgi:hypothetical protein
MPVEDIFSIEVNASVSIPSARVEAEEETAAEAMPEAAEETETETAAIS